MSTDKKQLILEIKEHLNKIENKTKISQKEAAESRRLLEDCFEILK